MKFIGFRRLILGRRLVFFHIGKCAGSTFRYAFMKGQKESPIQIQSDKFQINNKGVLIYREHDKSRWRWLRGTEEIVTFIRNPFARLESAFYYSKTKYSYDYNAEYLVGRLLLEPFNYFPDWVASLMNQHCEFHDRAKACLKHVYHFNRGYLYYFNSKDWVKKNKDRFFFVGELEHYNTDIHALSHLIGRDAAHEQEKINQTEPGSRPRLSPQQELFLKDFLVDEVLCYQELRKLVVRG